MKSKFFLGAVACAFASLAAPTMAQSLYLDLGAGVSRADADCTGTTRCDRNGNAVRAILGYELTPNWAIETSLADLGRLEAEGTIPGVGTVQTRAKLRSAGLGVAATLPLGSAFAMTGRLGVASNKTSVSGNAAGASASDSETHTAAYVGAAVSYAWTKSTSFSLTLDRAEAQYAGEKYAVVAAGLGVKVRF